MPRKIALDALERFRRDGAWSAETLDALFKKAAPDSRDAALCSRIFYTTLQNLTLLDFYIDAFTQGRLEPKVRDILRVSLCQLLMMDRIPAHAVVSEAVKLCRQLGYDRASGLVNAVLRRALREKDSLPPIPETDAVQRLSILYSHPEWLVRELLSLRGAEGAEAVLRADNAETPLYIQTNTLKTTAAELREKLGGEPFAGVPGCLALDGGDLVSTPEYKQGLFYIQDPAARLAVTAAGIRPGMRVLDACAAPGGKSFAAAMDLRDTGEVVSRDIHPRKLSLVEKGAERMGISCIQCVAGDARGFSGTDYDVVLADVPCSGLGVIRKKPDIRYRDSSRINELPAMQGEILHALSAAVKPGGVLLYSTCTWRSQENSAVVGAFLAAHPEFEQETERTFWPDTDGTDGFYLCRMKKKI